MERCIACQASVEGEAMRVLPAVDGDALVDAVLCEACWPAHLATVRDYLAVDDHFELLIRTALVRVYLIARGVDVGTAEMTWWLDQIRARDGYWWRKVMCSRCFA